MEVEAFQLLNNPGAFSLPIDSLQTMGLPGIQSNIFQNAIGGNEAEILVHEDKSMCRSLTTRNGQLHLLPIKKERTPRVGDVVTAEHLDEGGLT